MSEAQEKKTVPEKEIDKQFELPSGKKATIKKGKGKHSMRATKMAGGDPGKIVPCIIQLLVLIDGERVTVEDLEEMDLKDYMSLMSEFSGVNF